MNRIKCHVKKGDQVEVISGNFRGSSGKILAVFPGKQRVVVEGVRIIKKHLRNRRIIRAAKSLNARVQFIFPMFN